MLLRSRSPYAEYAEFVHSPNNALLPGVLDLSSTEELQAQVTEHVAYNLQHDRVRPLAVPSYPTPSTPNDLMRRHGKTWRWRTLAPQLVTETSAAAESMDATPTADERAPLSPCEAAVPFALSRISLEAVASLPYEQTHSYRIMRERAEARAKAGATLGRAAVVPLTVISLFLADQNVLAPYVWGNSTAVFHEVASNGFETADVSKRIDIFPVGGMGIKDSQNTIAEPLVEAFSTDLPNSKLFALEEGTRLFLPNTYKAFDEVAKANPAGTFIFYGMSTGTKEMLYLGAYAREHYPDVRLIFFADSGPVDAYSTYELRNSPGLVSEGAALAELRLFGGPLTKSVIDMTSSDTEQKYKSLNGSINTKNFWAEIGRNVRDVWTKQGTPNSLRVDQLALIADNSAKSNMEAIASAPKDAAPTWFIYLAPTEDHTVDDNYAAQQYADFARSIADGSKFIVQKVDLTGLPHASERQYPAPYNAAITDMLGIIAASARSYNDVRRPMQGKSLANSIPR